MYPSVAEERRFVLRLYEYWQALRGDRDMPSLAQVDFSNLGEDGGHCLVLAVEAGVGKALLTRLGDELAGEGWVAAPGTPAAAFPADEAVAQIRAHLAEAVARKIPVSRGGYFQVAGRRVQGRVVLLPLSEDGATVSHVLGGVNFKPAPVVARARAPHVLHHAKVSA